MVHCFMFAVQDNGLEKSLTFQGVASSPNLQLEARMNELERKMKEMGDVCTCIYLADRMKYPS